MTRINDLLSIASEPIAPGKVEAEAENRLALEHFSLLSERNGFFAFESALLVRPVGGPLDVLAWNDASGWRESYGELAEGLFFFAEDVFGGQFAIDRDSVVSFDPETGDREVLAHSMENWADAILGDYSFLTGHPVAHTWQSEHGPLAPGRRLMPITPFLAGGAFDTSNMVEVSAAERMSYGAQLARHVRDLPDGTAFQVPYSPPGHA